MDKLTTREAELVEMYRQLTLADYLLGASNLKEKEQVPLSDDKGNLIIQRALKDTGLLDEEGVLSEEGAKVISDFISSNADILKKLINKN